MADTTETTAQTSEGEGVNTAAVEGSATQAATEVRTFTQDEVNEIVSKRLNEERGKLRAKLDKDLETKLAEAAAEREKSLEATITERVNAALNAKALDATRSELRAEYGLSDAQLERLTGSTPEELKTDAETLFGSLKQRKPPVLHTGDTPSGGETLDLSQLTPAQIREKGAEIWKNMRRS